MTTIEQSEDALPSGNAGGDAEGDVVREALAQASAASAAGVAAAPTSPAVDKIANEPANQGSQPPRRETRRDSASYLIISAHDYRTPRRSSLHFITDELAQRGPTRFFSLRYSALSRLKGDTRLTLASRANRKEDYAGVECFLWKTLLHPFNTRLDALRPLENLMFRFYRKRPHPVLVDWIKRADTIIFESGLSIIYFDLACKLNPRAKKIYRASDDLSTIEVADFVHRAFENAAPRLTSICMLSPLLARTMPQTGNLYYVPNGIDPAILDAGDPSPYGSGLHAVSVGSMLFDPTFFEFASHAFPEITFHVIGSGVPRRSRYGANVKVYGDMKYSETLPYIKHATFGIAPYISERVPEYLSDSSMKLLQYDVFGVPAVCPRPVVGGYRSRVGYVPGDSQSIIAAIHYASNLTHRPSRKYLDWEEVTDRILYPENFEDTRIEPVAPRPPGTVDPDPEFQWQS